jgi:regulator of cell morphogenesis and NO signaling
MLVQKENKIGEIVTRNFHAAQVFEGFGLDFCCGGKKTISDACAEKKLNPENVISELSKIDEKSSNVQHFEKWEPDFLIDYIVNNHHFYVVNSISAIGHHMQKVVFAHGDKCPEVKAIDRIFNSLKEELLNHMQKEEKMLFPYIKRMNIAINNSIEMTFPPFGSVENPLKVMESEHESAGKMMAEINKLSNGYAPPENACGTFKVLYQELKEFEQDLHLHVFLENNILFPKSLELESKLKLATVNKAS